MSSVKFSNRESAAALVVGVATKDGKLTVVTNSDIVNAKTLLPLLETVGASAKPGSVTKLAFSKPALIVAVGLGNFSKSFDHEELRRAAGSATRALAGTASADFALPHSSSQELAGITEGIFLGAYSFDEFRSNTKAAQKAPLKAATVITSIGETPEAKSALKRAAIVGRYTALTRDLINTPPNYLNPASFCDRIKKLAGGTALKGLKIEILNETQLRTKGYGGISSVGQGSANPPRLLHLSYNPPKAKKRYAFVGKGITFDSGGYALKPAAGMEDMKTDMSGAAAVCAAIMAIAELKLPVAIEAYACLAENLISDNATRPSDVISIYGGKTVEVINPDAEGRLVLADGLVRAQEDGRKLGRLDGIIDVATLTGAQVIALGTRTSAVMTNDALLQEDFLTAAELSGEAFWPMPLPEELRETLNSPIADLSNIGMKGGSVVRMGGMLIAGLFLREFIADGMPWVHLDIAGPAHSGGAHGYTPAGGTGVAVRSLITLAELAC